MSRRHDAHLVEKYQGFPIYKHREGYFWQDGGFYATVQEVKAEIDDFNRGWPYDELPDDTPSLAPAWYEAR